MEKETGNVKKAETDRLPSVHIRIRDELYRKLKQMAKADDRPVNWLVAKILQDFFEKQERVEKLGPKIKRADDPRATA